MTVGEAQGMFRAVTVRPSAHIDHLETLLVVIGERAPVLLDEEIG